MVSVYKGSVCSGCEIITGWTGLAWPGCCVLWPLPESDQCDRKSQTSCKDKDIYEQDKKGKMINQIVWFTSEEGKRFYLFGRGESVRSIVSDKAGPPWRSASATSTDDWSSMMILNNLHWNFCHLISIGRHKDGHLLVFAPFHLKNKL